MNDDDALAELDLKAITITEDDNGMISTDYGNLTSAEALWLLESARFGLLYGYWCEDEDDE